MKITTMKIRIRKCNLPINLSIIIFFIHFLVGLLPILPVLNGINSVYPQINTHNFVTKKIHCISFTCILLNNLEVLVAQILGGFLIGIPTFLVETYNALFLGYLIRYCIVHELSLDKIILLIAPHCIFEIPGIIIAGAAGFKIPYEIVRYLAGKKEQILTKEDIKEYLTLALISIILIVIAAWIEANVTLKIAKAMLAKDI